MGEAGSKPLEGRKFKMMAAGGAEPWENSYRKDLLDLLSNNEIEMVGPQKHGSMTPDALNSTEAWAGRKIDELHEYMTISLEDEQPHVVLIHIGTNNIAGRNPLPEGLDDELDNLMQLVVDKCPNATALVALIIPAAFTEGQVREFNQQIKGKVEKRKADGQRIIAVDMNTDWPGDALRDFLHPNGKGFAEMAERWKLGLEEANGRGWLDDC